MRVLVTGGAGYIGSHVARSLVEAGFDTIVYDNLSQGHREAAGDLPFVYGDVGNRWLMEETVRRWEVSAVIHLAARSLVAESLTDPRRYHENNVVQGLALLDTLLRCGVRRFILSSTAAVYGEPERIPIPEDHPLHPTNPYGESKACLEAVLRRYDEVHGLRYISLRYFNAAGAHPRGDLGEDHDPETHLIPVVLQTALGQRDRVTVFGGDFATPDGTAVRDYVHVCDLAEAHVLALRSLLDGSLSTVYNLGSGRGHSVKGVLGTVSRITGRPIPHVLGPRRPGDAAVLVASAEKIRRDLGWRPRHSDLETIVSTAWRWHLSRCPCGAVASAQIARVFPLHRGVRGDAGRERG